MKELKLCNTLCPDDKKCNDCNMHSIVKPTREEVVAWLKNKNNKVG